VPLGAELISIEGNEDYRFNPLVNYSKGSFKRDPDVQLMEESTNHNRQFNVEISEDAGKTVFGFWVVVEPKETKTVTLNYKVPLGLKEEETQLYVQRQPGAKATLSVYVDDVPVATQEVTRDLTLRLGPLLLTKSN
jgi:hypothetical protein